ncbi:MAG TPA: hypothetical protein VGB85_28875 [Nannocystis sp.]
MGSCDTPYVGDLEALWLHVSDLPPGLTGRQLRARLFAVFATALQWRWDHGGYHFRFAELPLRPGRQPEAQARELLRAMFPAIRDEGLALVWCEPLGALDDFLDRWLFFRRSRPYVAHDDVPAWMMPALREPWAACVRELVAADADARAAVLEGFCLTPDWNDHGVALMLVAGARVGLFHVGLCTD